MEDFDWGFYGILEGGIKERLDEWWFYLEEEVGEKRVIWGIGWRGKIGCRMENFVVRDGEEFLFVFDYKFICWEIIYSFHQ